MKKTRTMKKVASIATAALMTACLAVPMATGLTASALRGTGDGAISITAAKGEVHANLSVFQIFTANITGENKLTITGWGDGVNVAELGTALKDHEKFSSLTFADTAASAQAVSDAIASITDPLQQEALARIIAKNVVEANGKLATKPEGSDKLVVTDLPTGYYIAVDLEEASKDNFTGYTLGLLAVVTGQETTATTKIDFPSFDKQIGDINDSSDAAGSYDYSEAADHDMGDAVPFRLIATVPENISDYETYKMIFHDNLQADVFSFNASSVKVNYYESEGATPVDVTESFTLAVDGVDEADLGENTTFGGAHEGEKNEDFTLTCLNIKNLVSADGGGYFQVDYTATLTTNANMGATGNWNSAYLEYSNNPNYSGSGQTGNTDNSQEDSVVAFTYQTVVNKTDAITGAALPGATFTLEKVLKDGSTKTIDVVTANEGTTFVFNGLDDGDYILTETDTPDNYNGINPITFTISAAENKEDGAEALESLSAATKADTQQQASFVTGKVYVLNAETQKTEGTGAANGSVVTEVKNNKGTTLPGTGGIGTTLFYLIGGTMFAGSGVYLISKKRMKNKEEQ